MDDRQVVRAMQTLHKAIKLRAIRRTVQDLGMNPDSVEDNVGLLQTLAPVSVILTDHIMEDVIDALDDAEDCATYRMKAWFTALQVHGTLEDAAAAINMED